MPNAHRAVFFRVWPDGKPFPQANKPQLPQRRKLRSSFCMGRANLLPSLIEIDYLDVTAVD
jgi:hypothetical protein